MDDVTPNDMPGAVSEMDAPDAPEAAEQPPQGLSPDKLAELNRTLRNERKAAEKRAKDAELRAEQTAQQLKQVASLFGDGKADEFDPRTAIEQMRQEFNSERKARLLSEVARTEGVEPEDIQGDTEEQMRESALKFKERFENRLNSAVEAALKARNPSAPPISTVTADGIISGPEQITSREQLKSMTPQQIMAAQNEGRLNHLLGKKAI